MTQYPSTLAKYYKGGPVGIFPGQSMFETDATRVGLYAARNSFISMLNIIFARSSVAIERTLAVETLSVETPVTEYLVWRRPDGTNELEATPPSTMYDYTVYSLEERNQLLANKTISDRIMNGEKFSVLVNGLGNDDTPQWSVYQASLPASGPTPDYIVDHPNETYALAKNYDHHVATIHDRDVLTLGNSAIDIGTRVLVDGVASTSGFWTIWEFVGQSSDSNVDAAGFKLLRYQTYRTADFWSFADWYGDGYSVSDPPVVRYATAADRDRAENPIPTSTFVRLDNDGTGVWVWTVYSDGAWNVVARQNGTIAFSSKFYDDPTRPIIGLDPIMQSDLANIPNRDGSWEFQVMFDQLRDSPLLLNVEVNEVFFSMLHFIHAQQDQVTWAFKTSFLNVAGYNESLTQTPVQPIDNTQNLLNYLDEVKPYRVKTRDFTRILTPPIDYANTSVKDFDFPVFYDNGTYRVLDPTNTTDNAIIQTQEPWKSWYANYLNPVSDPTQYDPATWNPVRHMTIGMLFDRVDHMPILADQKFIYVAPEVPTFSLLDIGIATDIRDEIIEVYVAGRRLFDVEFVAESDSVSLTFTPDDGAEVRVTIRMHLTAGLAADREQRFYDPTNSTLQEKNLRELMGLHYKANVLDGGDLGDNSFRDYDVDGNADIANAGVESLNSNDHYFGIADPAHDKDRPQELIVAGSGESLHMVVQSRWTPGGPQQAYRVFNTSSLTGSQTLFWGTSKVVAEYVEGIVVFFDGERKFEGTDYTIDFVNREITADITGVNEVIVKTFGISSYVGIEEITEFTYLTGAATFPLDRDFTSAGYLKSLTVNGEDAGFTLTGNSVSLTSPPMVTPARVLFIATPTGSPVGSRISVQTFTASGSSNFTLANNVASTAEAIVEVNGLRLTPTTDYTITANTALNISSTLTAGDEVSVTAFSNSAPLAMLTNVTNGTVSGIYNIDSPKGIGYVWMSIDGKYVDPSIPQPASNSNVVVITAFRGTVLTHDGWAVNMARPSNELMSPKETGDYDAQPFDTTLFDVGHVGGVNTGSKRGDANSPVDRSIFVMRSNAYEFLNWDQDGQAILVGNLAANSTTVTIMPLKVDLLNPLPVSPPTTEKLGTDDPISKSISDPTYTAKDIITEPGVVWINGERIEFFDYTVNVDNSVTLSEIRRGTYNTRISAEERNVVSFLGDGNTTAFAMPGVTSKTTLSVSVFEPLHYANGQPLITDQYTGYSVLVAKTETRDSVANSVAPPTRDYTVNMLGSGLVVNFTSPPAANTTVYLATTGDTIHANGTVVHDGRGKRDINPDRVLGGEVRYL